MAERNTYIDFLRFVGLSFIVLAHVGCPPTLHQIRCCDVPLMLFVSGLSYSGKKVSASWKEYYWPRIKRLVIPIYIFVACYTLFSAIFGSPQPTDVIAKSFLLCYEGAIGYVWVIKIFLLIMLVTPLLIKLNERISNGTFFATLVGLIVLQEGVVAFSDLLPAGIVKFGYNETIPYLVGYSIPFLLGLRLRKASVKTENIVLVVTVCAAIGLGIYLRLCVNSEALITDSKYPPHSLFLLYGLATAAVLWKMRGILGSVTKARWISFIGSNTIWIYVWHTLFVILVPMVCGQWLVKFLLVYACAVGVYYLQYRLVTRKGDIRDRKFLKYFVG